MDLKKRLKGISENFDKAKERDPSTAFDRVPDGIYNMQLVNAELNESKSSNRLQASFEWQILGGEHDGRSVWDHQGLETEDNLFFFNRLIEKLGHPVPESADDIPDVLDALVEQQPHIQGKLRTKDEYQNLRVTKLLANDGSDDGAVMETEEVADEQPEAEDPTTYDVGDNVEYKTQKGTAAGNLLKWDGDDKAIIQHEDGKKFRVLRSAIIGRVIQAQEEVADDEPVAADPEEEVTEDTAPADTEEATADIGTVVTWKVKGKEFRGEIIEFPDDSTCVVKDAQGRKTKLKMDDPTLSIVADDDPTAETEEADEAEEPAPKAAPKKQPAKPAAQPPKKPAAKKK